MKKVAAFLALALMLALVPSSLAAEAPSVPAAELASSSGDCPAEIQTPAAEAQELPDFIEAPSEAAPGCTPTEIQACNEQCNVPFCEAFTFYINNQCNCFCRCRV